jgi:AcrR family transcriptional regulator
MPSDSHLPKSRRPRKRPIQARAQYTVEAILDAAIQVFERHGYVAGTTARIAERAGVAVGSLYQYFPNKDAILVAVALRHLEEGAAALEQLFAQSDPAEPLATLVRRFITGMLALHAQHPQLHRMLFEQVALPAAVWHAVEALEQRTAQRVAALLHARPDVQVPDPLLAAFLIVQIVESATHRLVLHPPPGLSRDASSEELVTMLVRYLTVPEPPR